MSLIDNLISRIINFYRVRRGDLIYYRNFYYWQKKGFHIIPNHYYSPVPDTSRLTSKDFGRKKLLGIRMNDSSQLKTLEGLSKYRNEFKTFKNIPKVIDAQKDTSFYFGNGAFDGIDALTYYGMIRLLRPENILEVGSGWSTKIAAAACLINASSKLTSIEPYPQPFLVKGFPGFTRLVKKKVENVHVGLFDNLDNGDILFIDSSHVVKIGGDVNYLFFEVLPRLKKGVYIHIHDIFLPYDYPKNWVVGERRFWSEQYLLHAFMLFNDTFEVVFARGYLNNKYQRKMKKVFSPIKPLGGGSFWIRKVR